MRQNLYKNLSVTLCTTSHCTATQQFVCMQSSVHPLHNNLNSVQLQLFQLFTSHRFSLNVWTTVVL